MWHLTLWEEDSDDNGEKLGSAMLLIAMIITTLFIFLGMLNEGLIIH
jgi:hypothetical protein